MKASSKDPLQAPQAVSLDYFLFSCFEYENTVRANPTNDDLRWPTALACGSGEVPESVQSGALAPLLKELCAWHVEKTPQLKEESQIDLSNLADIVPAFMSFVWDAGLVVKAKTQEGLPIYDAQDGTWVEMDGVVKECFPAFSKMFLRYLHWSYAAEPEKLVDEAGSRPPVGRFAPSFRSSLSSSSRSRGPAPSRERDGKPRSKDRGPRNNRDHRDRDARPPRGRQAGNKRNQELEKETLRAVLLAVQKINENSEVSEYPLPAANSFYRRLQHKQIADEGLFSKSDGEGADRHVVILREKPSK